MCQQYEHIYHVAKAGNSRCVATPSGYVEVEKKQSDNGGSRGAGGYLGMGEASK